MKISIARLGASILELELETGATVMDALKAADYNLDAVLSVKLNGTVVSMDTVLAEGNTLLVSQDKIKGGVEDEEGNIIKLKFDIKTDDEQATGEVAFLDSMSTFEIVKSYLHSQGISMNYFKKITDDAGAVVGLDTSLADGAKYTIVLEGRKEDDEDDC